MGITCQSTQCWFHLRIPDLNPQHYLCENLRSLLELPIPVRWGHHSCSDQNTGNRLPVDSVLIPSQNPRLESSVLPLRESKKSSWIAYPWKMRAPQLFKSKHWESLASQLSVDSISESQTWILRITSARISNLSNGLLLLDFPFLFNVNCLSFTGFCFLMLNIMMTLEQRMLMPHNQKIHQALNII